MEKDEYIALLEPDQKQIIPVGDNIDMYPLQVSEIKRLLNVIGEQLYELGNRLSVIEKSISIQEK